jgi:DNA excision repair protein ERCC-3
MVDKDLVCEYSGDVKDIGPITVATYQILTYRKRKSDEFPHLAIFSARDWGLIIYDEVHLLPAPVFRITAEIQARRRLGLTATLVREDHLEEDVFSLIGPKCFDVPWKVLESQGWIASAECHEVRVPFPSAERRRYVVAPSRAQFRIASENSWKLPVAEEILRRHQGSRTLVIGQYLTQLRQIAAELGCPIITGSTPNKTREELYDKFREGTLTTLVVSKVANFAVDLPEAHVAIQISGTFGSRQEEAQRLGRILRPKSDGATAHFYSLVTRDSSETEFGQKRQLFLTEQGYKYHLESADAYVPDLAA